jgi:hypothetical protein
MLVKFDNLKLLTQKSERVLDSFRKALQDYRDINNKLDVEENEVDKQLTTLNGKRVNIVNLKLQNENFINKLNNFLN